MGRVDDDTAQAHSPATLRPDHLRRQPLVEGARARPAGLRQADGHLLGSGCRRLRAAPSRRASGRTSRGRRVQAPRRHLARHPRGRHRGAGRPDRPKTILDLDCAPINYEDWDAFDRIDLGLALSGLSLGGTRWRQSDFDDVEFRRSFARTAVTDSLQGLSLHPGLARRRPWTGSDLDHRHLRRRRRPPDRPPVRHRASHPPRGGERSPTRRTAPSAGPYWNLLCDMLGRRQPCQGQSSDRKLVPAPVLDGLVRSMMA